MSDGNRRAENVGNGHAACMTVACRLAEFFGTGAAPGGINAEPTVLARPRATECQSAARGAERSGAVEIVGSHGPADVGPARGAPVLDEAEVAQQLFEPR